MVSSRQGFWSPTEFSDRDEIRDVTLENLDPASDKPLTEAESARSRTRTCACSCTATRTRRRRESGRYATGSKKPCRNRCAARYSAVVGYTWPGGALGISYPIERARCNSAGRPLRRGCRRSRARPRPWPSCRTALVRAFAQGAERRVQEPRKTGAQLYLFAAAVDNESIEKGEEFYDATRRTDAVVVIHSKKDKSSPSGSASATPSAVAVVRPVRCGAGLFRTRRRRGHQIDFSPHVKVVNGKGQNLDHGDYKDNPPSTATSAISWRASMPEQFFAL